MIFKMKKMLVLVCSLALLLSIIPFSAASAHEVSTRSEAADLRVAFGQLLGEHAFLAAIAMQKGIDGKADFADSAAALNENTEALTAAITSLFGKDAGDLFNKMWNNHIGFFVEYVQATAANDEAGKKNALTQLAQYRDDFAGFLAGATKLPQSALAEGLQMHVNHLVKAFDSYVAKDYTTAYDTIREAYAHMYMTGDLLSGAIAREYPDKVNNTNADNPAVDFRVAFNRLLGEHLLLAAAAAQKGYDGAADFGTIAEALNGNTADLTTAITSIYGTAAGKAFDGQWKAHIGFFVDYVVATAKMDEAGQKKAVDELNEYVVDFAAFLAGATQLPQSALEDALEMHVGHLASSFGAYAAKDYPNAYMLIREGYAHMFHTGDTLSGAIVSLYPDQFHKSPDMAAPDKSMDKVWLKIGSKAFKYGAATSMMDTAPALSNGHTYIPLRYLGEALGATVTWDAATQSIWVKTGSDTAQFWVGNKQMEWNGMKKGIGAVIYIKNGRTMVPVRFIAELFGWDVAWNASDWSITLTKKVHAMMQH
jgi:hypothetical protein